MPKSDLKKHHGVHDFGHCRKQSILDARDNSIKNKNSLRFLFEVAHWTKTAEHHTKISGWLCFWQIGDCVRTAGSPWIPIPISNTSHWPSYSRFHTLMYWRNWSRHATNRKSRVCSWTKSMITEWCLRCISQWHRCISSCPYSKTTTITPFFRTDPLLYHKFENMVIFRLRNLSSLCSPGNQDYNKIIFFIKIGRNRKCKSCIFIGISCNYESWYNQACLMNKLKNE